MIHWPLVWNWAKLGYYTVFNALLEQEILKLSLISMLVFVRKIFINHNWCVQINYYSVPRLFVTKGLKAKSSGFFFFFFLPWHCWSRTRIFFLTTLRRSEKVLWVLTALHCYPFWHQLQRMRNPFLHLSNTLLVYYVSDTNKWTDSDKLIR